MSKIKLEFEGWHCFSKKQTKVILDIARLKFKNANFIDNSGLLVEADDELDALKFCLETIVENRKFLGSWDGYTLRKISKRIVFNYQDKKRKLSFDYFKKLVIENKLDDVKVVLAGILYLDPDETKNLLNTIERDLNKLFSNMDESCLKIAYNLLIKYASTSERTFSLNKHD
jgi:hypothetical protein